jgi:hypothetical protein
VPSLKQHLRPIWALLLLSPIIGELLFGVTRITTIFVLLPQIGTWGCAALLIRELVRRTHGGWSAVLLMGLALAVAEECIIQQTSLAPLVGLDPARAYDRVLGVNWLYFLWALGYESVWIVVLPIQLVELIFPAHREEPWLRTRGIVIAALVFLLSSLVAWYTWTQLFLPQVTKSSPYRIPSIALVLALAAIVMLVAIAAWHRPSTVASRSRALPVPAPWLAGTIAFVLTLPWFGLVFLAYGAWPSLPRAIPMILGIALAAFCYLLVARWSASSGWTDSNRVALIFGAICASMLAGFGVLHSSAAPAIDVIGKIIFNVLAVALLIRLGRKIRMRSADDSGNALTFASYRSD